MEIMNMKLKMMSTLWENTYRVAIEDGQGGYIGTCRVVVNVPLDPSELPPNAPYCGTTNVCISRGFFF